MWVGPAISSENTAQFYYIYPPDIMAGQYQGPNGEYANLSDLTRAVNGTPCGVECTHQARMHWDLDRHRY